MILSRAIEHVEEQHRTGAFIEPAVVIPGVFIDLQVRNRNTARRDRALESQTLSTGGEPFVPR